jgi:RNA polymerase sigma-70 factor, ECF subfamily
MAMTSGDAAAAYEVGRAAWTGVRLNASSFASRAEQLGVQGPELAAHAADLYLAWACAEHDAAALVHFERAYLSQVDVYVGRLGLANEAVDELRQGLRIRLLLGEEPRIGQYSGRGPLGAWVRIVAIRLAADSAPGKLRERSLDIDALSALVGDGGGPELTTLRHRYADVFQAALERSLEALEPRDKTILRMYFVDLLNIDEIGRIYHVHRATVARWLVGVRKKVLDNLRRELSLKLETTSSEFRSILQAVRDDLALSLRHLDDSATAP